MTEALACRNLTKSYAGRRGEVTALREVNLNVGKREFVCIVGPSGCGKTTLLKLIAGLMKPTSGQINFAQEPLNGRPRSALVFQEHGLFPWMTVLDNAAFGLEMQGLARPQRFQATQALLDQFGLGAFARHYPHELSVGMQQRVGIARAFVADPQILLMDEPFGALDAQTKIVLQEELLRIWQEHHKTVVYVTHDIEEAIVLGDRILIMTGRPGGVREEVAVPLPRPRTQWGQAGTQIMELKWHIWKMLEDEIRREAQPHPSAPKAA